MFTSKEQLLYDSISEIAEHIGHDIKNPISLSLLCLDLGISFDDKGKIFVAFNKIIRNNNFDDLNLQLFKNELISIIPTAKDYSDIVIVGLIKAFSKNLIPELYPYSNVVDLELDSE
ncbi:TPA: hypothetical protein ACXDUQ_004044 [Clostridioides difficile]|uniref:hypothetical protein n=1 Tax=Clostridioides difficile TaxID=1496 RepID=UPI00093F77D9|nr:hypothetical protein [Clostridioides difficile]EGT4850028.1 hypothetical protein [Clostridioides difficile]MCG3604410.1 hypothetical protein [Clostridioides difficile]MCI9897882.1 hypothetical protein [Clostridioides difficile]MCI9970810.1 hypothetical protein [Clostridioides difficile]MCJ0168929.1 hypothetical protein [Clostridioides difficile]